MGIPGHFRAVYARGSQIESIWSPRRVNFVRHSAIFSM